MTTLDETPTRGDSTIPADPAPGPAPSATGSAVAEPADEDVSNAEPRRAQARDAGARARIAAIWAWIAGHVTGGGSWRLLPSLLDARPRTLREQRDVIRAHRLDRPALDGTPAARWRQAAEHAYDACLWVAFFVKAALMVCEWCMERLIRIAVLVVVVATLIRLF